MAKTMVFQRTRKRYITGVSSLKKTSLTNTLWMSAQLNPSKPWNHSLRPSKTMNPKLHHCVLPMDAPFQLLDWDRISDDDVPGALYSDNGVHDDHQPLLGSRGIEHYRLMREWYNKGYIHSDAATMQNQLELMKSGKYFAASQSLSTERMLKLSPVRVLNGFRLM